MGRADHPGVAVANTVVSLYYYLRVIAPMTLDQPDEGDAPVALLGRWSAGTTAITATLVVAVGLAAQPILSGLHGARLLP